MWANLINNALGGGPRKWAQGVAKRFRRPADRRGAPRYNIAMLNVYHWTGGRSKPEEVVSISETGAYFKTQDRWSTGTVIDLTLQRTSEGGNGGPGAPAVQHVVAKVVRSEPGGLCVGFLYTHPRERVQVREFLAALRLRSQ
jgi:hypothetical protein